MRGAPAVRLQLALPAGGAGTAGVPGVRARQGWRASASSPGRVHSHRSPVPLPTGDWCGSGRRAACGGAGPAVLHGELLAPGPLSGSGRRPVSFPPNASGAQHKVCYVCRLSESRHTASAPRSRHGTSLSPPRPGFLERRELPRGPIPIAPRSQISTPRCAPHPSALCPRVSVISSPRAFLCRVPHASLSSSLCLGALPPCLGPLGSGRCPGSS